MRNERRGRRREKHRPRRLLICTTTPCSGYPTVCYGKKNIRADDVCGSTIQPSHDEKRAKLGAEKKYALLRFVFKSCPGFRNLPYSKKLTWGKRAFLYFRLRRKGISYSVVESGMLLCYDFLLHSSSIPPPTEPYIFLLRPPKDPSFSLSFPFGPKPIWEQQGKFPLLFFLYSLIWNRPRCFCSFPKGVPKKGKKLMFPLPFSVSSFVRFIRAVVAVCVRCRIPPPPPPPIQ